MKIIAIKIIILFSSKHWVLKNIASWKNCVIRNTNWAMKNITFSKKRNENRHSNLVHSCHSHIVSFSSAVLPSCCLASCPLPSCPLLRTSYMLQTKLFPSFSTNVVNGNPQQQQHTSFKSWERSSQLKTFIMRIAESK